jgi:hypothetical protein
MCICGHINTATDNTTGVRVVSKFSGLSIPNANLSESGISLIPAAPTKTEGYANLSAINSNPAPKNIGAVPIKKFPIFWYILLAFQE